MLHNYFNLKKNSTFKFEYVVDSLTNNLTKKYSNLKLHFQQLTLLESILWFFKIIKIEN